MIVFKCIIQRSFFIGALLLITCRSFGQVTVDTTLNIEKLIGKEFLQGGVSVTNVTYRGNRKALGLFRSDSDLFPLSKGIFLSTGHASSILGPNNQMGTSGENYAVGDSILNLICRGTTYDAAVVEFDFIASDENLAFDYIFASEEYPEYVNSIFNDVFAFIITNPETGEQMNIAFLPRTHQPITVNNVNHLKNAQHYVNNPTPVSDFFLLEQRMNASNNTSKKKKKEEKEKKGYLVDVLPCKTELCKMIQYDGFTKVLTAKAKVLPGKVYHFKIAIADVQDDIYDSGVILKAHSFKSYDKFGYIRGDTTGFRVKDEDLDLAVEKKVEERKVTPVRKEKNSYTVLFDFDSYTITDSGASILNEVSAILKKNPDLSLTITAHTDSMGSVKYNERLSLQRETSVRKWLLRSGMESSRIRSTHFGETRPATDNGSDKGRALNRRVELLVE